MFTVFSCHATICTVIVFTRISDVSLKMLLQERKKKIRENHTDYT